MQSIIHEGTKSLTFNSEIEKYRTEYYMCTFLTSHGTGTELHDAKPWAIEMWKRYDS